MAHAIEIVGGKARFAYVGQPGWHGLGTKAPDGVTAHELGALAGLDWTVSKQPLIARIGDKDVPVRHSRALVRDNDHAVLDVVGTEWTPVQNSEAFDFIDLFRKTDEVKLETAGSLHGGRSVFVLAKIKDGAFDVVGGRDPHQCYLLFSNFHRSGYATTVSTVATRVVCDNTLQIALGEGFSSGARFAHVGEDRFTPEKALELLRLTPEATAKYAEACRFLASKKIKDEDFVSFIKKVYGLKEAKANDEAQKVRNQNTIDRLKQVFTDQPGAEIGGGTWYQGYHAVTFDTDHVTGRSGSSRFASAQYGVGQTRKQRAFSLALELAQAA